MPDQSFEGTSYEVVPGALRKAQQAWEDAKVDWDFFNLVVGDDLVMEPGDMGLLGRVKDFPQAYNEAREAIGRKVRTGADALQETSDQLDVVAKEYESKDADYYEKFGYLDKDLDER